MPIYEYFCSNCRASLEMLIFSKDLEKNLICPVCHQGTMIRKLSAPAPLPKTYSRPSGRTCCGREERCAKPPCSSGDPCRRG